MVRQLFLPDRAREKLILPSYVKLDMAFDGADSAKLYDKSRYRSHGDITGAAWATGTHGKALDFNKATPSYVEIASTYTQLDFNSEKFSFVIRWNADDVATAQRLFIRGVFNTDGYLVYQAIGGAVALYTSQSGAFQGTASYAGAVVAGTPVTIGISRDGAAVYIYKNGVANKETVGTHINPATADRSAKIGVDNDKVTEASDGKLEFLRIFGGIALSASEHLAWHNALA